MNRAPTKAENPTLSLRHFWGGQFRQLLDDGQADDPRSTHCMQ